MNQKVWFIEDEDYDYPMEKRPASPGPRSGGGPAASGLTASVAAPATPKSPALAFSLSMLLWGGGHLYLGCRRPGATLLAGQLSFSAVLAGTLCGWGALGPLAQEHPSATSLLVFTGLGLTLLALLVWLAGAVDAYRRAVRELPDPDCGVDQEYLPLLTTLFFPGWGHFLNGQPKMGSVCLLGGMAGLFSLLILLAADPVWPLIAAGPGHALFEALIMAAALILPVALLVWVVALYDIFSSRIGDQPPSRLPRFSSVLALLLAISLGVQLVPGHFYLDFLEAVRLQMLQNNMTLIPEQIQDLVTLVGGLVERP